jgi:hypothetical protein
MHMSVGLQPISQKAHPGLATHQRASRDRPGRLDRIERHAFPGRCAASSPFFSSFFFFIYFF